VLTDIQKTLAVLALEALVDPDSAVESVMELAANEPMGEEDLASVKSILQPWWDSIEDATAMMTWWSMTRPSPGSTGSRIMTLASCSCARLSLVHAGSLEDRLHELLLKVEEWAFGDGPVESIDDVRAMFCGMRESAERTSSWKSYDAASSASYAPIGGGYAVDVVNKVVSAKVSFAQNGPGDFSGIFSAPPLAQAAMSDLIRSACPEVPLPEPSGHHVLPTLGCPPMPKCEKCSRDVEKSENEYAWTKETTSVTPSSDRRNVVRKVEHVFWFCSKPCLMYYRGDM